jgi:uncharacterized protein (TIGR02453 family)
MEAAFGRFGPEVFAWFEGLERDNSRTYFAATRERYELEVRGGLEAMLAALAGTFGGEVSVFRQQRDLRFTPDKRPYKTRTYGVLRPEGPATTALYAELSACGLYAGTGLYGMARDQLERFRAAVDDERSGPALAEALASAETAGLEVAGASLRTAPRGFPRDHPRIELLRRRALIVGRRVPGERGLSADAALEHVAGTWRAAAPLRAWLDAEVGRSRP